MDKIFNRENVYKIIAKIKQSSKNCVTNFFPNDEKLDYWIGKNIFYSRDMVNSVFFFRKDRDFYHLYFYSKDLLTLKADLELINNQFSEILVADCIGTGNNLASIVEIFERCNFKKYILYNRMIKFINMNELLHEVSHEITFPELKEAPLIFNMFESSFDRFAEQLPTIEELEIAIRNREVFVTKDNTFITGVLIRKMTLKSSLFMFFLVNREHRSKKVGSKLLSYYFNECRNKRIMMWVLSNNANAIEIYKHYGFTFDSWNDQIMINKNFQYETRST
jgi:ribosomal protein S18 acetylase RimI-like enzyme